MWLVTRRSTTGNDLRRWIVENGFIHPPEAGPQPSSVCFPIGDKGDGLPPLRYMGRALVEEDGHLPSALHDHLRQIAKSKKVLEGHPLTAIGYGRATFRCVPSQSDARHDPVLDVQVSLGNTATEALSAQISRTQSGPDDLVEDSLEALHLLGEMDHLRIDTGAKFREARRAKGFQGLASGTIWHIVQPVAEDPKATKNATTPPMKKPPEITLPDVLAYQLNALNIAQTRADQALHVLTSVCKRLFADWYRYMLATYPPSSQAEQMSDIGEARFLIDAHNISEVDR
jgi:hypothetical protein